MQRVHTSIGKEWEGMNLDNADCGLVCLFAVLDVHLKRSKTIKSDQKRFVLSIQGNIIVTIQLRVAGGFTLAYAKNIHKVHREQYVKCSCGSFQATLWHWKLQYATCSRSDAGSPPNGQ